VSARSERLEILANSSLIKPNRALMTVIFQLDLVQYGTPDMNILDCEIPIPTLEAWSEIFVFPLEPIFLTRATQHLLPNELRIELMDQLRLQRREDFNATLEYRDAYLTYRVSKEAEFVALLKPEEFRALPRAIQAELMALQTQLKRGQLYKLEFVRDVLGKIPSSLEQDIFADHFVLRFDVWNDFTPEFRYCWLATYVSLERLNCLSSLLPENTWAALPEQVRRLAGTFSNSSGANCFATVIAGLTPDLLESTRISSLWILEHEFLAELSARGFHDAGKLEIPVKLNSVITWLNSSGKIIHACLVLDSGLVLNKDAQSWFTPRQILKLEDVLESWVEDAFEVRVWS
jgi:hypothetical protein